MPHAHLSDRAILACNGPESYPFLQGLITNDVNRLTPDKPLYAALLTPQGKVLFDFILHDRAPDILLDCAASVADGLKQRLQLYKLRAKLTITARDDLVIVAAWKDGSQAPADPRLATLGSRTVMKSAAVPPASQSADAYLSHRLALGIPEGADFGQDKMFALDADLDELHGVAFDKGCYVGQELTARMKHRATARKRLVPVRTEDRTSLPAGAAITAGDSEIGRIVSTYGDRGFAVLRLDRLNEASSEALDAAGISVRIDRPTWLFS